ncbi:MAG: prolipoprotein diacylglyceryl transferase [Gammaproteobacteria bacterium]
MLRFPNLDPVAVSLGPIEIHWYGIAYLVGIGLGWLYLLAIKARSPLNWDNDKVGDVVFYAAIGAVLGGRIGYTLFYNFPQTVAKPLSIFAVWEGGMSFHGGVIGFIVAIYLFARKYKFRFLGVTDYLVCAVPSGLLFGRIANFVNQELWGAPTQLPWGVVFTHPAAGGLARHPSQLYEAILEGLVLFVILRLLSAARHPIGILSSSFLFFYGLFRFLVEFIRQPDDHIGYLAGGWLTMGQVLSTPMIIFGLLLAIFALKNNDSNAKTA